MEPSLAHGFHAEFQRIQNAMKKSLFKRVDYAGSCSELLELGAALRREGSAPNAAMCLLAAAQCQKALENATAAAHCEAQAGQLLSQDLHLAAAGVDDATFELLLPDAARCYLGAINIYLEHEHWSLAGNLYAELAGLMSDLGHLMDASLYYEKAAHLMEVDRALAMAETLLDRALRCRIQSRDYDGAIQNTSNTLVLLHRRLSKSNVIGLEGGNLQGLYSRIAHAQVTKVLLLALAQKYAEALAQLQSLESLATAKVHLSGRMPASEIHTVLSPVLAAFVSACEDRNRMEAEAILREAPTIVPELCQDLMLRAYTLL